jgi:four helix bundle protein
MNPAEQCHRLTRAFPKEELYGLASQVRRAAASVPTKIAKGYGRENRGEYVQFLRVAEGSLKELETHLILAAGVQAAPQAALEPILAHCDGAGRMLRALIRSPQGGAQSAKLQTVKAS